MAHRYRFPVSPVAASEAVVGGQDCKYRFTVLSSRLIRYEWAADGVFEDRASTFAINRQQAVPKFRVVNSDQHLEIVTESIRLHYDKRPFTASGLSVHISGKFSQHGALWRYGDDCHDFGGTARTLDEANGRIPLENGVVSRTGYATVDDSKSMLFDENGWIAVRRPGADRVDGYLFAFGHDYRAAIKEFFAISGNQPLLPRWSLGNWWSRYYAYTSDEYLKLMDRFKDEGLPFSVGVLDMDWHLVADERVKGSGWTGYSWDKKLFPDPEAFLKEMHKRGLKVTLNDHPAEGVRSFEDLYELMAKAIGQDTSSGDPVNFDITNREFCDAFFDVLHRKLEDQGVDFWWIDWQQGPHSRTPGVDPLWMLNHYHFLDNGLGGRRPVTFSRFGGPGSHRYPVGFSGDTHVTWESLDFQPEFTATASNIGYGWWSHDIGGHMYGHRDEELTTRWLQYGIFSPIMRLHSANNQFNTKEPWTFSMEYRSVMDKYLRLRHRLLPYLYSMNVRSSRESEPLVQPLYWHYPSIKASYKHRNEFLFGSELLVLPITSQSNTTTRLGRVRAWIPPKRHVDIFNGVVYDGNRELWIHRSLSAYPVLAREGSIIPLDAAAVPKNDGSNPSGFEIIIVVGEDCSFKIFEDNGTGANLAETKMSNISISFTQSSGTVNIVHSPSPSSDSPAERDWTLKFLACKITGDKVSVHVGEKSQEVITSEHLESGSTILSLGSLCSDSEIVVEVGADPQLTPTDIEKHLYPVVQAAYIKFELKREIWSVIKTEMSVGVKVGQLSALGLGEAMLNALMEYLVADSRS